ncbi:MAG TPA: glycosyltransferase family 2 protein [Anaeromyxobacteraceae bacterium]|nr:glycosyltransferase family 2 protein [Anaeromyxobacteraceae bacterium]
MTNAPRYSIIVPAHNEEAVLAECHRRLKEVMDTTRERYELIFVDDGSRDRTGEMLQDLAALDPNVKVVSFSRNFGHQIAISAGMDHASGDAVIVIDADLQDPPSVILDMIAKWKEGYDVVYGRRGERQGETAFKKATAFFFYRLLRSMTEVDIPTDVGDFRLIDRKVCDVMAGMRERNRFVRGIISWIGFRQTSVTYVREKRFAGETKYPLSKMLRFALDAIFGFSYRPLKLASYLGLATSLAGFAYAAYALYLKFFTTRTVQGWTSIIAMNLVFNGIVLLILGIMGEYIGRIYDESKARPFYVVRDKLGFRAERNDGREQSDDGRKILREGRRFPAMPSSPPPGEIGSPLA